jgi:hypothetical protein
VPDPNPSLATLTESGTHVYQYDQRLVIQKCIGLVVVWDLDAYAQQEHPVLDPSVEKSGMAKHDVLRCSSMRKRLGPGSYCCALLGYGDLGRVGEASDSRRERP